VTGHFVGRSIARKLGIPWIADYRDLWSGPPIEYFNRNLGKFPRAVAYPLERWMIRSAAAITTPTEAHRRALIESFGRTDTEVIPNACDLDVWNEIPDVAPSEFRLCYAGAIHERLRTPDLLFEAVAKLRIAGEPAGMNAKLDFYGSNAQLVVDAAARYGISDAVVVHGEVEREVAMRAQRRSAVLVLLLNTEGSQDAIEADNVGSKIFEYVGARRHVLAIGSAGCAGFRLLDRLGIGLCASDVQSCMEAIIRLYKEYLTGRFQPALASDWVPYTPADLARDFAAVLDRVNHPAASRTVVR
jgi:glycosyltransferase involved in cell wall biosynthesis